MHSTSLLLWQTTTSLKGWLSKGSRMVDFLCKSYGKIGKLSNPSKSQATRISLPKVTFQTSCFRNNVLSQFPNCQRSLTLKTRRGVGFLFRLPLYSWILMKSVFFRSLLLVYHYYWQTILSISLFGQYTLLYRVAYVCE